MKVLLKVSVTTEYDVITDAYDSLLDAKEYFDPSEDLQGAVSTYCYSEVKDAIQIYDCPDCKGRGVLFKDDKYIGTCKRCRGNGYVKEVPE